MYRMRWANETGGDWFGDADGYADLADCWIMAQEHFSDDENECDYVQAWEIVDGHTVSDTAAAEWSADDFSK